MHILINFQADNGFADTTSLKKSSLFDWAHSLSSQSSFTTILLIYQNGTVFITQETTYVTLACDCEKQTKASKCKEGQIVQQNGFLISVC